jgi:hypothetical protein
LDVPENARCIGRRHRRDRDNALRGGGQRQSDGVGVMQLRDAGLLEIDRTVCVVDLDAE